MILTQFGHEFDHVPGALGLTIPEGQQDISKTSHFFIAKKSDGRTYTRCNLQQDSLDLVLAPRILVFKDLVEQVQLLLRHGVLLVS